MDLFFLFPISFVLLTIFVACEFWFLQKAIKKTERILHNKTTAMISPEEKKELVSLVSAHITENVEKAFAKFEETVLISAKASSAKLSGQSEKILTETETAASFYLLELKKDADKKIQDYLQKKIASIDTQSTEVVIKVAQDKFHMSLSPALQDELTKNTIELYLLEADIQ